MFSLQIFFGRKFWQKCLNCMLNGCSIIMRKNDPFLAHLIHITTTTFSLCLTSLFFQRLLQVRRGPSLSLRFISHFPGEPGLAGVY